MKNKIYLCVGVFDLLHYGHLKLFKKIKQENPSAFLIVAVQKDEFVQWYKPNVKLFYNYNVRKEMLESIKEVNQVVAYERVQRIVQEVQFDVFCVGEDQNHQGFKEAILHCKQSNKEVLRFKRTEGVSSSEIREYLDKFLRSENDK